MPDQKALEEAAAHLAMSDEALLRALVADEDHAFAEDALVAARRKLRNLKASSRTRICGSAEVQTLLRSDNAQRQTMLVAVVADILATGGAMVFAALLIHEGLDGYCGKPAP
jgi:hypothetical protein